MLPVTVPASHRDAAHPDAGRRVSPALLALDEWMFNPHATQWFFIDDGNTAVPKTTVTTLVDGLELVGRGQHLSLPAACRALRSLHDRGALDLAAVIAGAEHPAVRKALQDAASP